MYTEHPMPKEYIYIYIYIFVHFHSDSLTLSQALLALRRVERLLVTIEEELLAGDDCSDTFVTTWGEHLSHVIYALGVSLKYVSSVPVPALLPIP